VNSLASCVALAGFDTCYVVVSAYFTYTYYTYIHNIHIKGGEYNISKVA